MKNKAQRGATPAETKKLLPRIAPSDRVAKTRRAIELVIIVLLIDDESPLWKVRIRTYPREVHTLDARPPVSPVVFAPAPCTGTT
jgi:hypothetical protein